MHLVTKYFVDLQDNEYAYAAGDVYPRLGLNPSLERIAELAGSDNAQGVPLIRAVEDTTEQRTEVKRKRASK